MALAFYFFHKNIIKISGDTIIFITYFLIIYYYQKTGSSSGSKINATWSNTHLQFNNFWMTEWQRYRWWNDSNLVSLCFVIISRRQSIKLSGGGMFAGNWAWYFNKMMMTSWENEPFFVTMANCLLACAYYMLPVSNGFQRQCRATTYMPSCLYHFHDR